MSRIAVMRHGRSLLNLGARIAEAHNVLSPEGVHQALAAGESLKEAGIRLIASSPIPRAWQTATIVSGVLGGVPVEIHPELAELATARPNLVEEWQPQAELDRFESDIDVVPAWSTECQRDVFNRTEAFRLRHWLRLLEEGPSLIVCHTFVLRAILASVEHGDPRAMTRYFPKNAEPIWLPAARPANVASGNVEARSA